MKLEDFFNGIEYLPVWTRKEDEFSIRLNFGTPFLETGNVDIYSKKLAEPYNLLKKRKLSIKGEWVLFTHNIESRFYYMKENKLESLEINDLALTLLQGQYLKYLSIDLENQSTQFHFDLGLVLKIKRSIELEIESNMKRVWSFFHGLKPNVSLNRSGELIYSDGNSKNLLYTQKNKIIELELIK